MRRTPRRAAQRKTPQQLAVQTAEEYIGALIEELPLDAPPGGVVNLAAHVTKIQDAILDEEGITDDSPDAAAHQEDAAMRAGYMLGVQIGLRLRGGA